ncbi:recombinase family protein [Rhodobacter capsulatus]|uniref:recombinase family protein n=1 Tax=Rhodobacter capsulatus TaxID=1061 RepID=UPI004025B4FF
MPQRVAIYARVSTDRSQTVETQLRQLHEVAQRLGWIVVAVHTDEGISGAHGRDKRPGLDALMKQVMRKEVDMIAAWSVDRLGRSLQHLVGVLSDLQSRNVGLYLHVQGLDTTTPSGRAMYQLLGVFAEFEREMIRERVLAGIDRARARGKRLGRPSIPDQQAQAVRNALAQGLGIRATARATGTAITTVARIKKDIEQPDDEPEHDLPLRDLMASSRSIPVIEPIPHRAPRRRQGQTVQGSCPSPSPHPAQRSMRWQGIITVPPTVAIV